MHSKTVRFLFLAGVLVLFGAVIVACSTPTPPPPPPVPTCPPPPVCPTAAPCPTAVPCPKAVEPPFQKAWESSGHADKKAVSFTYWDKATPPEIPVACAQCHSSTGYQEFLATGKIAKNVPIGTTVDCFACHNEAAVKLTAVKFPSGAEIKGLGAEARCMICHEGRASKKQIDDQIARFNATDLDKPVAPMKSGDTTTVFGFINPHYFTAAATLYGTNVKGGYEYEGKSYEPRNQHVTGYDSCTECHDSHTLKVKITECATCHPGVKAEADLRNIRMVSSVRDFNGNGNVKEGLTAEIKTFQELLLKAIYAYAKDVAGLGVVYDPAAHPYYFQDKDGDGKPDKDDKGANVSYPNWTPRMLKAAYNYQFSAKDPGAYSHNPKYVIQLLYDSIADLNSKLPTKVDMAKLARDDVGHYNGSKTSFRYWDQAGLVPASCAKCHTSTGLPQFIANAGKMIVSGANLETTGVVAQPPSGGLLCSTCHVEKLPGIYPVVNVPFPNGANLTFSTKKDDKGNLLPDGANLCLECHQGRQSTPLMNNYLAAFPEQDKVESRIAFRNIHYFSAGATLFGNTAKGVYEYPGKTYVGRFMHVDGFVTCTDCHDKHSLDVKVQACQACHKVDDVRKIRMTKDDFSGSKDPAEPMAKVIETFTKRLYAGIQKYAADTAKTPIVYDSSSHPYFFLDKNNDGKPDTDEKGAKLAYNAFTPRLLKAAYNYQYALKDPGAFSHNPKYVLQALYDSIEDIKGDLTGLTRPK